MAGHENEITWLCLEICSQSVRQKRHSDQLYKDIMVDENHLLCEQFTCSTDGSSSSSHAWPRKPQTTLGIS
ncbi:hypothetical protein Leryth_001752 [Lithospermum erythrorhizon]|nr:hypothetical protein Leryth_001752 [Lithospermum erythrorhizon]